MPDQIALKLLRQSDLTLFDPIWQRDNDWLRRGMIDRVSKQKAINLNAREFLDTLYPGVREAAQSGLTRIPLSVTIYGPNGAGAHDIARKAVRSPGSKNWRLNGETIHEPEGEPGRYSRMAEGDLALLRFDGEPQPTGVVMALLSAAAGEDEIIRLLMPAMDDTGMVLITPAQLAAVLDAARVSREHPAWRLADDADAEAAVERAMEGDTTALEEVRRRRRRAGGGVSLEQWLRARAAAEATGRAGEEMVAEWLGQECDECEWVADVEPLSPFDMLAEGGPLGPGLSYLDVKTTKASFGTRFHISMGEAAFAAEADRPYRIVRVFDADGDAPCARISEPINEWARDLLEAAEGAFPEGVRADGFVVQPEADGFMWGPAIALGGAAGA
jgi:hypothetical protein